MLIIAKPLQGWGGVNPMQLKANFKVLTGMEAFLVSKSDINDHVDRLVTVRRLSP